MIGRNNFTELSTFVFKQQHILNMLSKNQIKFIQSLSRKKIRDQEQLFIAEGNKLVDELLNSSLSLHLLCATKEFMHNYPATLPAERWVECSNEEIRKASLLKNPQDALALFRIPQQILNIRDLSGKLTLALDNIQDPGNLGTIIRLADWFGIEHILCSKECADLYNPKVIQATMGAVARTKVYYIDLPGTLPSLRETGLPVYGTTLDGENIYSSTVEPSGIIVMGNEGKGISGAVARTLSQKLYIPSYPPGTTGSESLNVAIATSIVCAEFRRRQL